MTLPFLGINVMVSLCFLFILFNKSLLFFIFLLKTKSLYLLRTLFIINTITMIIKIDPTTRPTATQTIVFLLSFPVLSLTTCFPLKTIRIKAYFIFSRSWGIENNLLNFFWSSSKISIQYPLTKTNVPKDLNDISVNVIFENSHNWPYTYMNVVKSGEKYEFLRSKDHSRLYYGLWKVLKF